MGESKIGFMISDHTDTFVLKEMKNPKTDFFGMTARFQTVSINVICIKLKFCEKSPWLLALINADDSQD